MKTSVDATGRTWVAVTQVDRNVVAKTAALMRAYQIACDANGTASLDETEFARSLSDGLSDFLTTFAPPEGQLSDVTVVAGRPRKKPNPATAESEDCDG